MPTKSLLGRKSGFLVLDWGMAGEGGWFLAVLPSGLNELGKVNPLWSLAKSLQFGVHLPRSLKVPGPLRLIRGSW